MRIVKMFEEVVTRKEFMVEVPDEVTDDQAEEWAINEVMYNLSESFSTGKEDVIRDEFVDAKFIH